MAKTQKYIKAQQEALDKLNELHNHLMVELPFSSMVEFLDNSTVTEVKEKGDGYTIHLLPPLNNSVNIENEWFTLYLMEKLKNFEIKAFINALTKPKRATTLGRFVTVVNEFANSDEGKRYLDFGFKGFKHNLSSKLVEDINFKLDRDNKVIAYFPSMVEVKRDNMTRYAFASTLTAYLNVGVDDEDDKHMKIMKILHTLQSLSYDIKHALRLENTIVKTKYDKDLVELRCNEFRINVKYFNQTTYDREALQALLDSCYEGEDGYDWILDDVSEANETGKSKEKALSRLEKEEKKQEEKDVVIVATQPFATQKEKDEFKQSIKNEWLMNPDEPVKVYKPSENAVAFALVLEAAQEVISYDAEYGITTAPGVLKTLGRQAPTAVNTNAITPELLTAVLAGQAPAQTVPAGNQPLAGDALQQLVAGVQASTTQQQILQTPNTTMGATPFGDPLNQKLPF